MYVDTMGKFIFLSGGIGRNRSKSIIELPHCPGVRFVIKYKYLYM